MAAVIPKKMSRLNSSVDVIPIQGSSNEDSPTFLTRRRRSHKQSIIRDPMIINRVKEVRILSIILYW